MPSFSAAVKKTDSPPQKVSARAQHTFRRAFRGSILNIGAKGTTIRGLGEQKPLFLTWVHATACVLALPHMPASVCVSEGDCRQRPFRLSKEKCPSVSVTKNSLCCGVNCSHSSLVMAPDMALKPERNLYSAAFDRINGCTETVGLNTEWDL